MPAIDKGRLTARRDEAFAVFLIGFRINRIIAVADWWPVFSAMPRMINELSRHPELGFLGAQSWFGRTTLMVQYWRSVEDLNAYAKARDHAHLPAWTAFNQRARDNPSVGVYHETYRIEPGNTENVYVNMPPTLLGRVAPRVPAEGALAGAEGRMKR